MYVCIYILYIYMCEYVCVCVCVCVNSEECKLALIEKEDAPIIVLLVIL